MKKILAKYKISDFYYIFVIIGYFLTLPFEGFRPGVFASVLLLMCFAEAFFNKSIGFKDVVDKLVIVYFAYLVLSVIWLTKSGYPLRVYVEELTTTVLPMIFYFVGKSCKDCGEKWYKYFVIGILILGIFGVLLYAFAPQFYNDWCFRWGHTSKADAATTRVRMNSVVGSTSLSFLSVAGMLAASFFIKVRGKRIFGIVGIFLSLIFAVLANQRSGLVAAFLVIIYINYLLFFELKVINRKYFFFELGFIALFLGAVAIVKFDFILKFWYRIISLPGAVSERSEQWIAAVNNMSSSWFGNGLGANGHKALFVSFAHVVADGGLVKMYCEEGVIGFSLFIYLCFITLKKGIANISRYYVEIGLISIAILQSIGSNILAFQLCTPIFWFAVGRICENSLLYIENGCE